LTSFINLQARAVKAIVLLIVFLTFFLMGCAVDRRWGSRRATNQRFPGSFGVDSRWGEPRSSLLKAMEWQY
jgi:hypothetical protein